MYPQPGVEISWRLPQGQLHHTVSWNNSPNGLSLILKHKGGGAQLLTELLTQWAGGSSVFFLLLDVGLC